MSQDAETARQPWCFASPYHLVFVAIFAVNGLCLVALGVLAVAKATDAGNVATGFVWLAAGANALVAAAAVVRSSRWMLKPAFAASVTGVLVWLFVIWADHRSPSLESWWWPAAVMAALSLAAVAVIALAIHLSPITGWKAVIATVLPVAGVLQFWYTTQYAPGLERPHINLSMVLSQPGPKVPPVDGRVPVQATITVENKSRAQVHVLGSVYSVVGFSPSRTGTMPEPYPAGSRLLQADRVVPPGTFFEPDEMSSTTVVVMVPEADGAEVVRASAELIIASGARLELNYLEDCFDESLGRNYECTVREVESRSAIEALVNDDPIMTTLAVFDDRGQDRKPPPDSEAKDPPVPWVRVYLDERKPRPDRAGQGSDKLQEKFNVLSTSSSYELPLRLASEAASPP